MFYTGLERLQVTFEQRATTEKLFFKNSFKKQKQTPTTMLTTQTVIQGARGLMSLLEVS